MYITDHWYIVGAETYEINNKYGGHFYEHKTFDNFTEAYNYYQYEIENIAAAAAEYKNNGLRLASIGLYHFINHDAVGYGERLEMVSKYYNGGK